VGAPGGMGSLVHHFDGREGGSFRISLTCDSPTDPGKSTAHTDAYHGSFQRPEPNDQVVEVLEFETVDEELRGVITMTTTVAHVDGGTDVFVAREWNPLGVSAADATGTRAALAKIAVLVEENSPEAIHPWRMSPAVRGRAQSLAWPAGHARSPVVEDRGKCRRSSGAGTSPQPCPGGGFL
jgi:uncharacterized protein YndB with AHSA1/START domain